MSNRWCWGVNVGSVDIDPGDLIYLDPADRRPVFFGAYSGVRTFKKEEANMKTDKMPQETIAALHKSIAHWNDICYGVEKNAGPGKCALCQEFSTPFGECRECPINTRSMRCYDKGSAYRGFTDARTGIGFCTVDSAEAAEAMLELLVSLLPGDEQWRYSCYFEDSTFQEWMLKGRGWGADLIGITTDGRNAFPQAKYVWRRVFEYQASEWGRFGNIRFLMPADEWAECPTKWWISTTKDGKCVTCGQVVKKKVVKYKVLYAGRYTGGAHISDGYFESGNYFDMKHTGLRCIHLIKETAKEFDV